MEEFAPGKNCQNCNKIHHCPREYCSDCTCKYILCFNLASGNGRYCSKHLCIACKKTGKSNFRPFYTSSELTNYCLSCRCKYGTCTNIKLKGFSCCKSHFCSGCNKDIKEPGSNYCFNCRCLYQEFNYCPNQRSGNFSCCEKHLCDKCHSNRKDYKSKYCPSCKTGNSSDTKSTETLFSNISINDTKKSSGSYSYRNQEVSRIPESEKKPWDYKYPSSSSNKASETCPSIIWKNCDKSLSSWELGKVKKYYVESIVRNGVTYWCEFITVEEGRCRKHNKYIDIIEERYVHYGYGRINTYRTNCECPPIIDDKPGGAICKKEFYQ